MKRFCLAAACLALLAAVPAGAQINPFSSSRESSPLNRQDRQLLLDSIAQLNAQVPIKVGDEDQWSNPATGLSGTNTVLRIFTSNNMPCHRLHHTLAGATPAQSRAYDMTWCRTAKGEWRSKG